MSISLKNVELFENLAQIEFNGDYYDFHNEFKCVRILFENDSLIFLFKSFLSNFEISLNFYNVNLVKFKFLDLSIVNGLTIDIIYRGRFDVGDKLLEFSSNNKSYVYFEFCEGIKGEFFSNEFSVEKL